MSTADQIRVAELTGTARHHARWRELTPDEHDAAVAALRELAAGRADLLAQVAGLLEGFSEGQLDGPLMSAGCGAVPRCRGRPGADPALDRGGAAPQGECLAPVVRRAPEDPAGTAPAWPGRLRGADMPARHVQHVH